MSKAFKELEWKRREAVFAEFKHQWWWFDPANKQHVHQFSAAWEILRRTQAYRLLHDKMHKANSAIEHTPASVRRTEKLISQFRALLPQSPPSPIELCEMIQCWQSMIINGWTPEKTYLEASKNSKSQCVLPSGKTTSIPPVHGTLNQGVPIILPRQISAQGHTELWVELCDVTSVPGQTPCVVHVAGDNSPTMTLKGTQRIGNLAVRIMSGRFVAIEFSYHHPVEALLALVKTALTRLQESGVWPKTSEAPVADRNSRGPKLVVSTCQMMSPLRIIAFFSADEPPRTIQRGFHTLIRPEKRMKKFLSRVRKEWIEWDSAERTKFKPALSQDAAVKLSRAAWRCAETYSKLACQSTARPIKPKEDLDNLACNDCAPIYHRNRSELPDTLPDDLRKDCYFNKRIKIGGDLIRSQDKLFLPLLSR